MSTIDREALREFASTHIVQFHQARLDALKGLDLDKVLRKKNPYLFRAENLLAAGNLVAAILDAYLSSSEEGIFGRFLEELAIFVSSRAYGGRKSSAEGLGLEFDRGGVRYLVAIKSGPNWGSSSQQARLRDNFTRAITVVRQSQHAAQVQAVLGICYGKRPGCKDKGLYLLMTGQRFWHFLSGDEDLYLDIIDPVGDEPKQHNDDFERSRSAIPNRLTSEFIEQFCDEEFCINWNRLVAFNSGNITRSSLG